MIDPKRDEKQKVWVQKSLAKLRAHRRLHNLCRDCGIVKENERKDKVLCGECAPIQHAYRAEHYRRTTKKQVTSVPALPLPMEGPGRVERMMQCVDVLLRRRA